MSEFTTLVDAQVDEVVLIKANAPYKNGERAKNKETYSSFRFNGMVFNVPDLMPFAKDFREGNIASIKLAHKDYAKITKASDGSETTVQVKGLEFDSHRTLTSAFNRAKHSARMEQLKVIGNSTSLSDAQILMLQDDNI